VPKYAAALDRRPVGHPALRHESPSSGSSGCDDRPNGYRRSRGGRASSQRPAPQAVVVVPLLIGFDALREGTDGAGSTGAAMSRVYEGSDDRSPARDVRRSTLTQPQFGDEFWMGQHAAIYRI
jgi:hypothetical protein